jgi:hypothetical protein
MLNWDIETLSKMQDEIIRQAQKDHLAQEVIDDSRKSNPHYNPTLAWVGRRMMSVGIKLVQISGSEADKESLYKPDIHLN